MIVECLTLISNPEYEELVENAEKMGMKTKDFGVEEYIPVRFAFDPCCIDFHKENLAYKGYSDIHILDHEFTVKISYEQLLKLRQRAVETEIISYV